MLKIINCTAMYNGSQWIKQCLESVATQDYPCEIWVCDDKSYDNSVEVALSLFDKTPIVHATQFGQLYQGTLKGRPYYLLCSPINERQGAARNKILKLAWDRFDYVKITDCDDWLEPDCVSTLLDAIKDDLSCGVSYSDYYIVDEKSNTTTLEYKQSFSWEELHKFCLVSSGALIKKEVFEKCGFYYEPSAPTEDYGLWLKASNYFVLKHVAKPLWYYRTHSEQSTVKDFKRHQQMHQLMASDYQEWRKNNKL
jgi:glycosyltransferase involved in cell wall biosynthesis